MTLNRYQGLDPQFIWTYEQIEHWLDSTREELLALYKDKEVPSFGWDHISFIDGGAENQQRIAWGDLVWMEDQAGTLPAGIS